MYELGRRQIMLVRQLRSVHRLLYASSWYWRDSGSKLILLRIICCLYIKYNIGLACPCQQYSLFRWCWEKCPHCQWHIPWSNYHCQLGWHCWYVLFLLYTRAKLIQHVVVHLSNGLANNGTGIHFHGIRQNYTNQMDGVPSITQCPVAPGEVWIPLHLIEVC